MAWSTSQNVRTAPGRATSHAAAPARQRTSRAGAGWLGGCSRSRLAPRSLAPPPSRRPRAAGPYRPPRRGGRRIVPGPLHRGQRPQFVDVTGFDQFSVPAHVGHYDHMTRPAPKPPPIRPQLAAPPVGRAVRLAGRFVPGIRAVTDQIVPYTHWWDRQNHEALDAEGHCWPWSAIRPPIGIGASAPQHSYAGQLRGSSTTTTTGDGRWRVLNLGQSGARVRDATRNQLPHLVDLEPDLVICCIGTNDVVWELTLSLGRQLRSLMETLPAGAMVATVPGRSVRGRAANRAIHDAGRRSGAPRDRPLAGAGAGSPPAVGCRSVPSQRHRLPGSWPRPSPGPPGSISPLSPEAAPPSPIPRAPPTSLTSVAGILSGPVDGPDGAPRIGPRSRPARPPGPPPHLRRRRHRHPLRHHHQVTLRDQAGREHAIPVADGAFSADGKTITLIRPSHQERPEARPRPGRGRCHPPIRRRGWPAPAGSWSRASMTPSLVEKVWGDDLRAEGVVVEPLHGADDLAAVVAAFQPGPDRRLGVLLDHLVGATKEQRIADSIDHPHVLITGHPYVDIWQAIKPEVIGIEAWPTIPIGNRLEDRGLPTPRIPGPARRVVDGPAGPGQLVPRSRTRPPRCRRAAESTSWPHHRWSDRRTAEGPQWNA